MKIVIEHSKTKREIIGPFNICGTRADLERLARLILNEVDSNCFCFGWIKICDQQESIVNDKPIHWDESKE